MIRCRHLGAHGAADFALPGTQSSYAPDLGLEPCHVAIDLRFDLAARRAEGQVTTTVVARRAGQRTLELDAVDLLAVTARDPDGRALSTSYDGKKIRLCWDEAPPVGDQRRVEVRYSVQEPLTGLFFSESDEGGSPSARWAATDHETERARYWLPCLDHPAVRTPLDLRVRADANHTILANGVVVGEEAHDDGTKTVHWRLEQPCPSYLICLVVGDLVRADGGSHGEVDLAFFAPTPHAAEDLQRSFGGTQKIMQWMVGKLGSAFPYPKYFQIALPGIGGAMENISLTTWDDAFVTDERLYREWGRLVERINVHEMAHSYFGDAIVIRDFAHAWLKESWATYVEALWVEDTYGQDELRCHLHVEARDYMGEADERYARPIVTKDYTSSWDMFDQHLYPGGAWRIHMLRQRVGEQAFWAAVHDYVRTYSGKLVETADFRRTLEQHSGLSLGRFFDEWLHSPGYPKLKIDLKHDAERGEVKVSIEQTQADTRNAKKGIGLFTFDLEVAFEVAEGEWQRSVIPVSQARHSLVLPLAKRPRQVVVDPDQKLLFRLDMDPGTDMLERSLRSGPVTARIHAAETLTKKGSPAGVKAVEDAWGEEPQWGVRIAMAKALSKAGSQVAAEALARRLLVEEDPKVLAPLADACGKYRDPVVAEALETFLKREDLPYHAHAAALRALGSQRGDAHIETLTRGANDDSWWGWVRRGALTGLGSTRSEAARALLTERTRRGGEPTRVRTSAVLALGGLGRWLDERSRAEVLKHLIDLTRDSDYNVRMSSARALGSLGEGGAMRALEALTGRVAAQDVPRLRRIMAQLQRRARGGDVGKLKKRTDELEDKLRKLALRVELLESRGEPGKA